MIMALRIIVGLSGSTYVKYSWYSKDPEELVLIIKFYVSIGQVEAALPKKMETSPWTSSLICLFFSCLIQVPFPSITRFA